MLLAIAETVIVAIRPVLRFSSLLIAFSVVVGLAAGDIPPALTAALWASLALGLSQILHEGAHLAALRTLTRAPSSGAIFASRWQIWVVSPRVIGWRHRCIAAIGPAAGLASVCSLGPIGLPQWIAFVVALTHALNYLPVFPDGRALWRGSAAQDAG